MCMTMMMMMMMMMMVVMLIEQVALRVLLSKSVGEDFSVHVDTDAHTANLLMTLENSEQRPPKDGATKVGGSSCIDKSSSSSSSS